MKLRSYQEEAINAVRETFLSSNRQYIEMPTGAGKTITFLSYAKKYHDKVLIVVPSRQLMNQVYETACLFYDKSEISRRGDRRYDVINRVHIVIVNSLKGEHILEVVLCRFDLVIIDEAHHSQSDSYKNFMHYMDNFGEAIPYKYLGVTATPDKYDGSLLNQILYKCSFKLTLLEMIEKGNLCDIEGYRSKTKIDISELPSHNGDFSINDLYKKLCIDSRNSQIVDVYKNNLTDRKTIIFCINIDHSKIICNMLISSGFSSVHIDGTMKSQERKKILDSFRDGAFNILCNCQLLTEGFDEPSIDGMILARPTKSRTLFFQMIGRGLRNFPNKKNCKIIDIVDNHKNLCSFNDIIIDNGYFEPINDFKSIKDVKDYVEKKYIEITEYEIQRTNLINEVSIFNEPPTDSIYKYLDNNNIKYFNTMTFEEGCFLVWKNELKKRLSWQQ